MSMNGGELRAFYGRTRGKGRKRAQPTAQPAAQPATRPATPTPVVLQEPVLDWASPAPIVYGTILSETQLNARQTTGNGALTYDPVKGTKLDAGPRVLKVTAAATPQFKEKSVEVALLVNQAEQLITWKVVPVWEGDLFAPAMLNAVLKQGDGALSYSSPAANAPLAAGVTKLAVTAAATTNFKQATLAVELKVLAKAAVQAAFKTDPAGLATLQAKVGGPGKLLDLLGQFSPDQLKTTADDLGGQDKLGAFLTKATPEQLKEYNDKLGGMKCVAALWSEGFGGDAAKFDTLKEQLGKDFTPLTDLIATGGLKENPKVLGQLLKTGCGGAPDAFKNLITQFNDEPSRTALKGVITKGGLNANGEILAHVLKTGCAGNPATLKTFCTTFATPEDQSKLKGLVKDGGLGGRPGEPPDRLALVLKDGLGANPAKLKELHQGFATAPPPGADLEKLKVMMDAFGSPPPPDGKERIGKRLAQVAARLKDPLTQLKDPFFDKLESQSSGGQGRAVRNAVTRDPVSIAARGHHTSTVTLAGMLKGEAVKATAAAGFPATTTATTARALASANAPAATTGQEAAKQASSMESDMDRVVVEAGQLLDLEAKKQTPRGPATAVAAARAELERQANEQARRAGEAAEAAAELLKRDTTKEALLAAANAAKLALAQAAKATDPLLLMTVLEQAQAATTAVARIAEPIALMADKLEAAEHAEAAKGVAKSMAIASAGVALVAPPNPHQDIKDAVTVGAAAVSKGAFLQGDLTNKVAANRAVLEVDANKAPEVAGAGSPVARAAALAEKMAALERAKNEEARLAGVQAQTAGNLLLRDTSKEAIKAAAKAAETAMEKASLATDETIIKQAIKLATAAADAAGKAALANAGTAAKTEATAKVTALVSGLRTATPDGHAAAVDAAGKASLQAAVANHPDAREKAILALQAEEVARRIADKPGATELDIKNAFDAAKLAADAAANATATAATVALNAALAALGTAPVTPAKIASVIACANAVHAAALNAPDPALQASTKAAAGAASHTAFMTGTPATMSPADVVLSGVANAQKRKINGITVGGRQVQPKSLPQLLRIGATCQKKPLAAGTANYPLGPGATASMDHVLGRHTREFFTFATKELADKNVILKAYEAEAEADILRAQGRPLPQAVTNAIKQTSSDKVTTLFPETITAAEIAGYVSTALAVATGPSAATYRPRYDPRTGFTQVKGVPVGGGYTVTIGFETITVRSGTPPRQTTSTSFKVTQFYPESGPRPDSLETMDLFDMHAVKSSLKA